MRLTESISAEIYKEKYNELTLIKNKLTDEKINLEVTLKDEKI